MNKTELIASVAEKAGMTKKDADKAIGAVFTAIEESLAQGEKVQIIGFGTFDITLRKAREGINPSTKEKIQIPETKAPVFKAGKALKDIVNK